MLVTVAEVRGHAPREAGAKMVVSRDRTWGSVGGGNLEASAIARARELIEAGAGEPELRETHLSPHARTEHGRQCCGGVVRLLLEPLPVRPVVAVFGLGHVGYELARILSRLPVRLVLADSRAEQLDRVRLADVIDGVADVAIHHTLLGEQVLERLPRGAHVVIMTHDHAEDFALCDAALRLPQPLGGIGLIGSSAKWARFAAQLADAGHGPEAIARITCPIGQPGITGKDPAVIAVAVASALLTALGERATATGAPMTIYAATVVDTPGDPFAGDPADALAQDGALLVRDGVIRGRGSLAALRAAHPGEPVTRLDGGLLVPGFVDTHVHFPQIRAIGGLGLPLLDWLEQCALPEESKLADQGYARAVAAEFLDGLVASGTTSALVFGSHFAPAMDELFGAAERRGLNITSGLVLSDRILRPDLLNSPQSALTDSADLILRWHDRGRLRYAVTPRFSLSASDEMLDACAELLGKGVWFTSHINENLAEIATVAGLFPAARHYLDTYARHGLVTARSVFAHNVHPWDAELESLADHGASVAHCPTSNSALGSGLFPLRRHVEHGIHVALGSDVGAGAGLFLPKEALQAYFVQQLLGAAGLGLTPVHLLYLATRAGARALGLDHRVGDFAVGKDFDAVLAAPSRGEHARGQPPPRPRHDRRAGADLRPGHPGRRGRGVDPGRAGRRSARAGLMPGTAAKPEGQAGAVGPPVAVAGDVLVDAEVVLAVPQHHGERQFAVVEFDDRELELEGFGGQQRAQRAHGHVVQLTEDLLAAMGNRVERRELVADRVEPVPRRGPPLADQRHALDRVVRAPPAHPVPVEKHQGHPRLRRRGRVPPESVGPGHARAYPGCHLVHTRRSGPTGSVGTKSGQTSRTSCPAASSSVARSPGRWPCGRGLCCSTRLRARAARSSGPMCST